MASITSITLTAPTPRAPLPLSVPPLYPSDVYDYLRCFKTTPTSTLHLLLPRTSVETTCHVLKSHRHSSSHSRELSVLKALASSPHQNLPTLILPPSPSPPSFIILPYYTPLTSRPTASLLLPIISAVSHLHSKLGYAHCDVKPDNVMVAGGEGGKPVLCDFSHSLPMVTRSEKVRGRESETRNKSSDS